MNNMKVIIAAVMAIIFSGSAMAGGAVSLPEYATENRRMIGGSADAIDDVNQSAALAMAAASHQFRVSEKTGLQGSIALGSANGEGAVSISLAAPISDSLFGTLQFGTAGAGHKAGAMSVTWGF